MPRFRFTVRRMMIAVAVGAFVMGLLAERRARFNRIADWHHAYVMDHQYQTWLSLAGREAPFPYHERMALKYYDAARHPWLPVAPDPPEPK